jgi:hypothetical protein
MWKHFTKEKLNGEEVTVCGICKTVIPYVKNTTNMWNHLKRGDAKHQEVYAALQPSMRDYKNKGPRKKRSAVWKHFNLVQLNARCATK